MAAHTLLVLLQGQELCHAFPSTAAMQDSAPPCERVNYFSSILIKSYWRDSYKDWRKPSKFINTGSTHCTRELQQKKTPNSGLVRLTQHLQQRTVGFYIRQTADWPFDFHRWGIMKNIFTGINEWTKACQFLWCHVWSGKWPTSIFLCGYRARHLYNLGPMFRHTGEGQSLSNYAAASLFSAHKCYVKEAWFEVF